MTWEQLVKLGAELPEVEEGLWYGTPSLKVRGKGFVRLKEDGESVVFMLESVDEQEFLIQAMPELYFITDHYRGYALVLARLPKLRAPECRRRLEQGWRFKAPQKLVKQLDAAQGKRSPPKKRPARGLSSV
ncbi:MmcQ/YjbR family DNA-binding protein [Hyalangium versicolor]|uniref:MmcQ/YjbR family DNA-binding protein n=1 Tax=Hyalangium versicolor TaxID=2861190 RepID=UPI001CCC7A17|nr:MmcQ/YjbR family DNA-binding protein [Hyalangium versicolor]